MIQQRESTAVGGQEGRQPGPEPVAGRGPVLVVRPWWEPELAMTGHDPLDAYAERYWLPVLGPTALCALRWIARGMAAHPGGFETPHREFARAVGLGRRTGANSASVRCLDRLCYFQLMRPAPTNGTGTAADPASTEIGRDDPATATVRAYEARTHLPDLPAHLMQRLPRALRGKDPGRGAPELPRWAPGRPTG